MGQHDNEVVRLNNQVTVLYSSVYSIFGVQGQGLTFFLAAILLQYKYSLSVGRRVVNVQCTVSVHTESFSALASDTPDCRLFNKRSLEKFIKANFIFCLLYFNKV